MPIIISLLRGVNVGGHNLVRMSDLREIYESLGFENPRTYLQSGNVVFSAARTPAASVIEEAIEARAGFRPTVVLRTAAELQTVVAENPLAKRDFDPAKLAVVFLAGDPAKAAREKLLAIPAEPEELHMRDRELYIYFPNGMARPKLSPALIERTLNTSGTARNWNTVMNLLRAAAENWPGNC